MTLQDWIQVLMGYLGSLGFNILFNIRGRKLFIASLGGFISWTVFLLREPLFPGEPIRYFWAAAAITVSGEVFARIEKTPTTTFLVPSVIPLIPGGSLYYTMNYAVRGDMASFADKLMHTIAIAGVIAVGVILVSTVFRMWTTWKRNHKKH